MLCWDFTLFVYVRLHSRWLHKWTTRFDRVYFPIPPFPTVSLRLGLVEGTDSAEPLRMKNLPRDYLKCSGLAPITKQTNARHAQRLLTARLVSNANERMAPSRVDTKNSIQRVRLLVVLFFSSVSMVPSVTKRCRRCCFHSRCHRMALADQPAGAAENRDAEQCFGRIPAGGDRP